MGASPSQASLEEAGGKMAAGQEEPPSPPQHCCLTYRPVLASGSARTSASQEQEWPALVILRPGAQVRERKATKKPRRMGELGALGSGLKKRDSQLRAVGSI